MKIEGIGIRKLRFERLFLLIASVSALLATSVISAGPLYFDSIERLGARRMIDGFTDAQIGAWVHVGEVALNQGAIDATRDSLHQAGDELESISHERAVFIRSGRLKVSQIDDEPAPPALEFQYQWVEGIDLDIDLVQGSMPSSSDNEIDVAILAEVATELGIEIGDSLTLVIPPTAIVHSSARVAGTFDIRDADDESWLGISSSLFDPDQGPTGGRAPIIALAGADSLGRVSNRGIADHGAMWGLYYTDEDRLIEHDVENVLSVLEEFRKSVARNLSDSVAFSGLQSAYSTLQRQLTFGNTTTVIGGSLFAAFALFTLSIQSNVVSARWRREESLLHARGAGKGQLVRAILGYAVLLFVVPAGFGPVISAIVLPQLGRLSAFSELTDGAALPSALMPEQFLWSALAAFAALLIYIAPIVSSRSGDLVHRMSRMDYISSPWLWRANLDFGIMVAAGAIIFELNGRGSLFIERGDGSAGLSILAASLPVVASVGAALFALRLLRLVGAALERLSQVNLHSMVTLSLRLFARSITQHAVLMLLVAGVIVVSINALGLSATLQKNAADRIAFTTASDVRITGIDGVDGSDNAVVRDIASSDWVLDYAWGVRTQAIAGASETARSFDLLSVDPDAFGRNSWFRSDFSDEGLTHLMSSLEDYVSPDSLTVPDDAVGLSAVAKLERTGKGRIDLWIRVMDSTGSTHTLRLIPSDIGSDDWQLWRVSIDSRVSRPIEVIGVQIYEPPTAPIGNAATLTLDALYADMSDGSTRTISEFDNAEHWHPMEASLADNTDLERVSTTIQDSTDGVALRVDMDRGTADGIRGIYISPHGQTVVPLIVSTGFVESTGIEVGTRFTGRAHGYLIPFEVRDDFELFPTMPEEGAAFAVANVNALLSYITPVSEPFLANTAELFIDSASGVDFNTRLESIKSADLSVQVFDQEELASNLSSSLSATAGWQVVGGVISTVALVMAASAVLTFIIHRQSVTRIDHALLEALGARKMAIAFEAQIRVLISVAIGITLGVIAGVAGIRFIADRMTRSESGEIALPPMQLVLDWLPIAGIALVMLLAAFAPIIWHALVRGDTVAAKMRAGSM